MSKPRSPQGRKKEKCSPDEGEPFSDLDAIVDHYIAYCRNRAIAEMKFYASQERLEKVIELAALAKMPNDKRHPHQRRIPRSALEEARNRLVLTDLQSCTNFSELHQKVAQTIRSIDGIGSLTIYDTALRIGVYLKLEPELVYLHRGTREGAKSILPSSHKQATLNKADLPEPFGKLKPREIEDCLCIYKDALKKLSTV